MFLSLGPPGRQAGPSLFQWQEVGSLVTHRLLQKLVLGNKGIS